MAAVLSSPTPSLPSTSVPMLTPPLLGSPEIPPADDTPGASSSVSSSPTTASEPGTPTGHHSLVPAYPYNVAMVPAAVNGGPLPDDSELTTRLPSICVDYLSHDWAEDDVWTSWKAMTRHKAEIANGVRLENASWRTWAKQRGNLKTVSPETLNWLKDSDVTWLYGPLHTAVEAVPPPREATANERLGLEPLRSLSDTKAAQAKQKSENGPSPAKPKTPPQLPSLQQRRNSTKEVKTKPILKYRSLSDILMPQGQPTSPVIEQLGMDFEDQATISVHHARSDSHLVRLNSLNRKSKRSSPLHSPGSSSPERTASDSSSAASQFLRKQKRKDRRHISFNHRVEQCIAVDSDDARPYSTAASSDEDDDDVLTFGARSPRHASFARPMPAKPEPHTIARLGPTTLKSVELYPAPSPSVVFTSDPSEYDDGGSSSPPGDGFGQQHVEQYEGGREAGQRAMYDYQATSAAMRSQWDPEDEDDYSMGGGYDYFGNVASGPDVGMGDEYDMVQYGSTHLVGGSHNNYRGGSVGADSSSSSYLGGGPYSPTSPYNPNTATLDPSAHASSQIPHYRDSQQPSTSSSPPSSSSTGSNSTVRGPHSPASSREAAQPKRSALKGGRSRESSVESTPVSSAAPSPSLVASTSPPTGINAIATAIPPHVRPSGPRRTNSSEDGSAMGVPERGRSASRGSSSSLEREASANRRSSSSISPTSSYSPPMGAGTAGFGLGASGTYGSPASTSTLAGASAGSQPIAIQPRGAGVGASGSYDSLSSVMSGAAGGGRERESSANGSLPGVPEEEPARSNGLGRIVTSSSVDSLGSLGSFGATSPTSAGMPSPARSTFSIGAALDEDDEDDAMVEDAGSRFDKAMQEAKQVPATVPDDEVERKEKQDAERKRVETAKATSSPPSANSSSSPDHSRQPSLPRLRNASPSTMPSEDGHGSPAEPTLATTAAIPSPPIATTSSSPLSSSSVSTGLGGANDDLSLKRTTSGNSTSSASSYARRSLLRAARASSDNGSRASGSREREPHSPTSAGFTGADHDYAFGAEDDLSGAGVGRGIDVAGTARDLLGAISKGIWGSLGSGGGNGGSGSGGRSSSGGR